MILAIDPSITSGTGLVVADPDTDPPRIHDSACVKIPDKTRRTMTLTEQVQFITRVIRDWLKRHQITVVALEEPPARVRPIQRTNADGTKSLGVLVSPGQHRLVGAIEQLCTDLIPATPVVYVTPGQAKRAVGLAHREKRKPVAEVEAIVGHPLAVTKYASEAVADAYAVAMAMIQHTHSREKQG